MRPARLACRPWHSEFFTTSPPKMPPSSAFLTYVEERSVAPRIVESLRPNSVRGPFSMKVPIVLETRRLLLRAWSEADLEPFFAICSDPAVMQFVGTGRPWSREQTQSFLHRAADSCRRHGFCQWAVIQKQDGVLIGFCGFVPSDEPAEAEIGWRLAQAAWGRGLATEIARAVLDYGWASLGLQRVTATVQAGNRGSLRVIEKLGMQYERTFERNGREVLLHSATRSQ
jgi:[ribosomal protein S5]-alanine N-acetyltransferase